MLKNSHKHKKTIKKYPTRSCTSMSDFPDGKTLKELFMKIKPTMFNLIDIEVFLLGK